MHVVGAIRGELKGTPDSSAFNHASDQLASLGKSLPLDQLRLDVDRANLDLTKYWGKPTPTGAGTVAADLQRIQDECS
jgi:hypothetical protein